MVMGLGLLMMGIGLEKKLIPGILMEGLMLPMPAILMAQVHVRLAHLAASILKKKISKPLIFIIH